MQLTHPTVYLLRCNTIAVSWISIKCLNSKKKENVESSFTVPTFPNDDNRWSPTAAIVNDDVTRWTINRTPVDDFRRHNHHVLIFQIKECQTLRTKQFCTRLSLFLYSRTRVYARGNSVFTSTALDLGSRQRLSVSQTSLSSLSEPLAFFVNLNSSSVYE